MEISNQVIELIRKEIQSKCSGMDTLTSDIEVINKSISYFVDFTFKDTFVGTDYNTGISLGSSCLEILKITAYDEDFEELEIENIAEVVNSLQFEGDWN